MAVATKLVIFCLLFTQNSMASHRPEKIAPKSALPQHQVIRGGQAGAGFSIRDIGLAIGSNGKEEKIVIDVGDVEGRPLNGQVGYFHSDFDRKLNRLSLDLAQLYGSEIDELTLSKKLANSSMVRNSIITMDPEDHSTNILLYFNRPVELQVFSMPSKGQLVIEIGAR